MWIPTLAIFLWVNSRYHRTSLDELLTGSFSLAAWDFTKCLLNISRKHVFGVEVSVQNKFVQVSLHRRCYILCVCCETLHNQHFGLCLDVTSTQFIWFIRLNYKLCGFFITRMIHYRSLWKYITKSFVSSRLNFPFDILALATTSKRTLNKFRHRGSLYTNWVHLHIIWKQYTHAHTMCTCTLTYLRNLCICLQYMSCTFMCVCIYIYKLHSCTWHTDSCRWMYISMQTRKTALLFYLQAVKWVITYMYAIHAYVYSCFVRRRHMI